MPRSTFSPSKVKTFGSLRLHPYAQNLPINPSRNVVQPKPTLAEAYPVLEYIRRSNGESRSSSLRRRRPEAWEYSALKDDGEYDADDDMNPPPMHYIEPISYAEAKYGHNHGIERQDTPRPQSPPCPILPNINQRTYGADYYCLMSTRTSSYLNLPPPMNYTSCDEISSQQIKRLNRGPIKFLDLADIAISRSEAQVQALLYPRECIDQDGNTTNRFVTDCNTTSGRVYDRLFRRELARITPYKGTAFRRLDGHVFDVLTGTIRERCMFDDLRDINAKNEGSLDIIEHECDLDYKTISISQIR